MADPWWLPGCKNNIAKIPGAKMCSDQHCTDAQNQGHMVCYCCDPFQNGCSGQQAPANCGDAWPTKCCSYTAESPFIVFQPTGNCYCCCGCLAYDTSIAVTQSEARPIQEIRVGDPVYVAMDTDLKIWQQIPIRFSSGTGGDSNSSMIQVRFGDPDLPESVIATRNQLFLLPGKKLKRASTLVPGQDQLVRPDGSTVPVLDLVSGKFSKGVHMISTSNATTTDMAGHLIIANGVICGDYSLQLTHLEEAQPSLMAGGTEELPEFGTKEYGLRYKHLFADAFKAHVATTKLDVAAEHEENGQPGFTPYALVRPLSIPENATAFLTLEQARDIEANAPRAPIHSGAGKDITAYLFKLFKGFYPTVHFYVDDTTELPNAYSFINYDIPVVVINGGLIRTNAIQYESLAFVIAHQLGVLFGGSPKGEDGFTCKGQADYAALVAIFPYVWFGYYSSPMLQPAINQIRSLFEFIDKKNRDGVPGNECNLISIDCRLSAMESAVSFMPLPECAGGPPTATLEVTGATAEATTSGGYAVTISFNDKLDVETAQELGNYGFNPLAPLTSASVPNTDYKTVIVQAGLKPGTDYVVSVQDVLSSTGHPLVRGKSSAPFSTPKKPL
ncbi:hypothetical protein BLA39750_02326 [Burkholderia lata]|uniref:Uncharacterized protein n=1 Tax=Burkholderia lata (strain ATCC 17760 / DSM 23089 / LMG 22485 / NCIMB 9086 / R18194 / 383) TaxID=482957 RepID=A0A6P2WP94_BURL3|nr:hypothetical protein [Burkholderia lata]VWC97606.1 hypothetical protein BLA39750_02326 [Burkholderia lata]